MGTEVLRPQDCLIGRMIDSPTAVQRRRSNYGSFNPTHSNYYNPRINRRSVARPDQKKRFGSGANTYDSRTVRSNPVSEKVTILRRGDLLVAGIGNIQSSYPKDIEMKRVSPDPELLHKNIRVVDFKIPATGRCDMYAGSAFSNSPAPSSLPLPSFSKKKEALVDDSATRDLRRLLGLDL